jgi:hypothetical protein
MALSPNGQMARPSSRASSRGSIRSPSPVEEQSMTHSASLSATINLDFFVVSIRTQMSSLKHEIRHKQAQYNNLETTLLSGPRPIPTPSLRRTTSMEGPSAYENHMHAHYSANNSLEHSDSIKEGVPATFGARSPSVSGTSQRSSSPTRTLSRK